MQHRMSLVPEVIQNLIIINVLMYLASAIFPALNTYFALHPISSEHFRPYQIVTHMFMHDPTSLFHIFFNMLTLYMFGRDVEHAMGAKKFLLFYFATGLGAVFLHQLAGYIELQQSLHLVTPEQLKIIAADGYGKAYMDVNVQHVNALLNTPAVGASGAIFGVLAAFAMLYPNRIIMLLIPPIPMKAKYLVLLMACFEFYRGFSEQSSNVAHFAHLGGALFGYFLILYWRHQGEKF